MVAAKSRMNTWHRGEVKGIEVEKNLVDIYYVDYGDSDYVNFRDLRRLEPKFYELPLQAVEFRLDGIELPDEVKSWSEEAIIFFENVVYSSEIKSLELISTDNSKKSSVRLFDYEKNVSIADLLVDKGYCRKI
jgi:endonuclease YncB( thermonuclease family)